MSDYLWDPSGEIDPEIEEFEEALSYIRYRPGTPELPERLDKAIQARRTFRPKLLAAAAALAFVLLATGLWLVWHNNQSVEDHLKLADTNQQAILKGESAKNNAPISQPENRESESARAPLFKKPRLIAQRRVIAPKRPEESKKGNNVEGTLLTQPVANKRPRLDPRPSEITDGKEAKEQIMLALQIASEKLSLAQRMARGPVSR